MRGLIRLILLGSMIFATVQANAHHSWAAIFDVKGDIEIEGVVTDVLWRNPHVQFLITTDRGTAEEASWTVESNAVARLTRMGVTKDLIQIGDAIKAAGLPSLTGKNEIFVNHLMLADQTEVVMSRTAGRRWTDEAGDVIGSVDALHGGVVEDDFSKRPTSIFGVWNTVYEAEGSHRALRGEDDWTKYAEEFNAAQRAAGLGGRPDRHDCSPRSAIIAMAAPYPMALVDNGDTIEIKPEYFDSHRTVYMDPNKPIPDDIPKDMRGYSRGHWLGDTLVVETLFYRDGGIDGDDYMQVHETFNLSSDHNRLAYSQVIVDPLMRATPKAQTRWWQYQPGAELQAYNCAGSIE